MKDRVTKDRVTKDRIEQQIEIDAPVARVWRALTDHREFGEWFRVKLNGPFVIGEVTSGQVTYEGYEHMKWEATVRAMEAERYFAFSWCPLAEVDDESTDKPETLVEFKLAPSARGTTLVISESGFDALPEGKVRDDALRENTNGWQIQANNIIDHVAP